MPGDGPYEGVSNPPDGGNVSTVTTPPADSGAQDQWLATAGGGSAKPAAPVGAGTQQPPAASAGLPQQQQPAAPKPPTAPVVTSTKRGGLLGVMDSVTDALAGKTRPEVGTDAAGNAYVKQHTLTRGQQWMRIAGTAFRGAAAGLAAGKGAGNAGKAAQAGIEAQQQASDKEKADARQKVLDNANNQMLRMKMAEETWGATRRQIEASQHDIAFWQGQEDRLKAGHAELLGTAAHPGDISEIQGKNPDVMKDLVHNHSLEFVPQVGEDGKTKGFAVYKTPQGYRDALLPTGAEFPTFNSVTGAYDWHKTSAPTSQGEIDDYWNAAGNASLEFKNKQQDIQTKAAQQKNVESETTARDKELPGKMAETQASIAEKRANASKAPSEIAKNWAEANAADAKAIDDAEANGQGAAGEALVDAIGKGQMPVGRMAYIMARKPELLAAVVKKYPDFDGSKVDSYVKAYQDFTSGKSSVQLNAGGTALMHLKTLEQLNTDASYIPGTAAHKDYINQATTLATELAKFYGDATIPAIDKIYQSLTGIQRGTAIRRQATSMSKKMDEYRQQWVNAAPSAVYEAQMPRLAPEAEEARKHFDPEYRDWVGRQQQQQPTAAAPMAGAPAGATMKVPGNDGKMHWSDGKTDLGVAP